MGHVHLIANDPELIKRLWIDVFGAKPAERGSLNGVYIKGTYVWIEKGASSGGTEGSVIRDIGLRVRNLEAVLKHAGQDGFYARQASRDSAQLLTPDRVLFELIGDPGLDVEVCTDHFHLVVPDAPLARRWYSDRFGHPISGIRLEFIAAGTRAKPTKGRALDHVGFDVDNLEQYIAGAKEINWESRSAEIPEPGVRSAFLADPWGTRIELVERSRSAP